MFDRNNTKGGGGGKERVGEHKNKGITEEQRKGFKYGSKVREQVFHGLALCGCGHSTCVVSQGRYRALWWKHALHPAGLLWVVEAEEVGLSKTQGITWEKKETRTLGRNYRLLLFSVQL